MGRYVVVRIGRSAPLAGVIFSDDDDQWVVAIIGSTDYADSLRKEFAAGVFEDLTTLDRALEGWVALAPVADWPDDLPGADEEAGAVQNPPDGATWQLGDIRRGMAARKPRRPPPGRRDGDGRGKGPQRRP